MAESSWAAARETAVDICRRRESGGLQPLVIRDITAACVEYGSTKSFDLSLVISYLAAFPHHLLE